MDLEKVNVIMDYYQAHWKYFDLSKLASLLDDDFCYKQSNISYNKNAYLEVSDEKFFKSAKLDETVIDRFTIQPIADSKVLVSYDINQEHTKHNFIATIEDVFEIANGKIQSLCRDTVEVL